MFYPKGKEVKVSVFGRWKGKEKKGKDTLFNMHPSVDSAETFHSVILNISSQFNDFSIM